MILKSTDGSEMFVRGSSVGAAVAANGGREISVRDHHVETLVLCANSEENRREIKAAIQAMDRMDTTITLEGALHSAPLAPPGKQLR